MQEQVFPAYHPNFPETPPRTTPFDNALQSKTKRLRIGLGKLIPAYAVFLPVPDLYSLVAQQRSQPRNQFISWMDAPFVTQQQIRFRNL